MLSMDGLRMLGRREAEEVEVAGPVGRFAATLLLSEGVTYQFLGFA